MTRDEEKDDEQEEGLVFSMVCLCASALCTMYDLFECIQWRREELVPYPMYTQKTRAVFCFFGRDSGSVSTAAGHLGRLRAAAATFFLFRSDETETRDAQVMTQERGNESIQEGQVPNGDRT